MKLDAQRRLRQHGQSGNWRFKGLLLAGLSGSGLSMDDVAKAWPTGRSDYRFLQANKQYDVDSELTRTVSVEEETDSYHLLSDFAGDVLEDAGNGVHEAPLDKSIQHMLFAASTPEEVDTLFREQLLEVVAEGAQRKQVARDGAVVQPVNSNRGDLPVADDRQYTYDSESGGTAEGGAIERDREGYEDTVSWDCKKVDAAAEITDEMIRHAFVDAIERQVTHVGETVENNINRVWNVNLIDNAAESHTADGADTRGLHALNGGAGEVDGNDFEADTFASGAGFRTALFDDPNLVEVQRAGRDMELRQRETDRVLGVEHLAASEAAYDGSDETFGYSSSGDVGAVVYQKDHNWLFVEHDIEVKDYEDPIRDLQGVNARAWVDASYSQPNAAAQVIHD